jgi:hypothetical protein
MSAIAIAATVFSGSDQRVLSLVETEQGDERPLWVAITHSREW